MKKFEVGQEYLITSNARPMGIGEAETDRWIADTEDPELRALRRRCEDTNPDLGRLSTAHQLQIDSAARVLRKLYEAEIGHPPMSWYERAKSNA